MMDVWDRQPRNAGKPRDTPAEPPCRECGGYGTYAVGPHDVVCAECDGTGEGEEDDRETCGICGVRYVSHPHTACSTCAA
jgi:hypothetical protein